MQQITFCCISIVDLIILCARRNTKKSLICLASSEIKFVRFFAVLALPPVYFFLLSCFEKPNIFLLLLSCLVYSVEQKSPSPPCPGCIPVFYPGVDAPTSRCFRIPSIIRTHKGTLLAFSENRISSCGDNNGHHNIVSRRSKDNGATWGPLLTIAHGRHSGEERPLSNPNPVEITFPDGSKAILLHFDTMNNPKITDHGVDVQVRNTLSFYKIHL